MTVERPINLPDADVSVVIPTVPENKLKVISALEEQSDGKFEVIVVADASLSRTEARNRGIKEANADIVAQTDDDCAPPHDWIETIKRHFKADPDLVLLEGPLDKHNTSPRNYIGANMAYRRDCALTVGGFSTDFDGWRADTGFGFRMEIEYGVDRCRSDPDMEVVHRPDTGTPLRNSAGGERLVALSDSVTTLLNDWIDDQRPPVTDEYSREPLLAIDNIVDVDPRLEPEHPVIRQGNVLTTTVQLL
jgi:glycosyltransferase involved in cell wall biosynthesis